MFPYSAEDKSSGYAMEVTGNMEREATMRIMLEGKFKCVVIFMENDGMW